MKQVALIWDLDGTLLDSYPAILAGLEETYAHYQVPFHKEVVSRQILQTSVHDLLSHMTLERGLNFEEVSAFRASSLKEKNSQIQLMDGAREVLEWTKEKGVVNFIYTHKGDNTHHILENFQLAAYFEEVLTSASGFQRKPHPEALNYLVDKYQLDKESTYYIGDRQLDVDTALAAGIGSLNLKIDGVTGNEKISRLQDIPFLFKKR